MTEPTPASTLGQRDVLTRDPSYWEKQFSGTPLSIVVPPYIRFLQGQVTLRKALSFLISAREEAKSGNPRLFEMYERIESSEDSHQAQVSYETFFASTVLIGLVSEVEHFLGNAVSAALRLYPEKMGSRSFRLSDILNVSSNEELINRAASAVLNDLMYAKPLDYLSGLCDILSIRKDPLASHWSRFVEIKARRDLGVHNNWVANEIYQRKVREAQDAEPVAIGTRLIPDFAYVGGAMDVCDELVKVVADALGEKWIGARLPGGQERLAQPEAQPPASAA